MNGAARQPHDRPPRARVEGPANPAPLNWSLPRPACLLQQAGLAAFEPLPIKRLQLGPDGGLRLRDGPGAKKGGDAVTWDDLQRRFWAVCLEAAPAMKKLQQYREVRDRPGIRGRGVGPARSFRCS
jgi:hypothetical protein